ncbi:hypothetical protein ACFXPN_36630 [Streptomyces griseorubiginosus]|uniref:hypothetical protein n=1 Tax=Streptomyces griseorubiginosus TaxID=67304 RepID=UPI0036C4EBBD
MSGYLVPDHFDVIAYHGDHQASARLRWKGENHDFTMTADGPWGRVSGKGADCFDALTRMREQLEPVGWFLGVNGARRDTWPSGSCRGAGGFLVCHLTPGVLPTREDLIQTFHEAPRETLATVAEQIHFEQQWRTSL